jgi:predicted nucleic-acid-binding protein
LITDVVLAEAVWKLTGRRYNLDKAAVCAVVHGLIGDGAFIFESSQVIWSSLCDYEETKTVRGKELDFVDSLIANKSRFFAENNGASLFYFYSFGKAVAQLKSTRKP